MITLHDRHWLLQAFLLAQNGLVTTRPNPRVGAVVVSENRLISEGWHYRAGGAHAEVMALLRAKEKARGATLYVTLEPCSHQGKTPPCVDAILASGISRVVYASPDPNPVVQGHFLLQEAGIQVEHADCMEQKLQSLNLGFFKRMAVGLPWVKLKMAVSLDGRIADRHGQSQWITGQEAKEHAHRLRNTSCAIITGIGTILADDPALTVRYGMAPNPPIRVVLDSKAQMPESAKILTGKAPGIWITCQKPTYQLPDSWQHIQRDTIDLAWLLEELANRSVNEVLIEAGNTLAGAFLDKNLVDEIWLYQAPKILGHEGRPAFSCLGQSVSEESQFKLFHQERLGKDNLLVLSKGEICSLV